MPEKHWAVTLWQKTGHTGELTKLSRVILNHLLRAAAEWVIVWESGSGKLKDRDWSIWTTLRQQENRVNSPGHSLGKLWTCCLLQWCVGLHLVSRILSPLHHADAEIGGNFEHSFRKQRLESHFNASNALETGECRSKVCELPISHSRYEQ